MHDQTRNDLEKIEDILEQRIFELNTDTPSCIVGTPSHVTPSNRERIALKVLHWFVRFILK